MSQRSPTMRRCPAARRNLNASWNIATESSSFRASSATYVASAALWVRRSNVRMAPVSRKTTSAVWTISRDAASSVVWSPAGRPPSKAGQITSSSNIAAPIQTTAASPWSQRAATRRRSVASTDRTA